jgi:DUF1680 family protein
MRHIRYSLAPLLFASLASFALSAPVEAKRQDKLEVFDYHGVTVDGGHLRAQLDEVREYYLRIPNDDLLKGFRERAGLPAPGMKLGGWYSADDYNHFGQFVSGLARLYAATSDPACREKVDALVEEWGKCIGSDGYFFYSRKPSSPHYSYDKMVGGLLDAHLYCGNAQALGLLGRITDWAVKNLERSRRTADTDTEWYTLSENLYRAYLATGEAKYRDFAEVWEYPEYWDIYLRNADIFAPRPSGQRSDFFHAYSHVNTLGGAGAAYWVKGDGRYLEILKNAYEYLAANQLFATGGYGPDEQLVSRDEMLDWMATTVESFETQCGTWAAFKLAKHLIRATGDAKYGDWVERLAINGIGASIPMTADGGVFYYSDYNIHGGVKVNVDFHWSCCAGSRPQTVADQCDLAYFKGPDTLCVNLFTPSTVQWSVKGLPVTVRQVTRFPQEQATELSVHLQHAAEFAIAIRTPQWLSGPLTVRVNGEPAKVATDAGHWTTIRRQWRDGDRLGVGLPMRLWASPLIPGRPYPTAILFGPVVLAARAPNARFVKKIDLEHLEQTLARVSGEVLTWRVTAEPAVLLRPFESYKEGENYFLYLDPTATRWISHRALVYQGPWKGSLGFHTAKAVGATVEGTFEGTGVLARDPRRPWRTSRGRHRRPSDCRGRPIRPGT